jgi:hypothetical protein
LQDRIKAARRIRAGQARYWAGRQPVKINLSRKLGLGSLAQQQARPNLGRSHLATAIVAVAFQPVRQRVQHVANRLVRAKRATPYEVL